MKVGPSLSWTPRAKSAPVGSLTKNGQVCVDSQFDRDSTGLAVFLLEGGLEGKEGEKGKDGEKGAEFSRAWQGKESGSEAPELGSKILQSLALRAGLWGITELFSFGFFVFVTKTFKDYSVNLKGFLVWIFYRLRPF